MRNIDKNRTATVITTITFSVLALAAIIYQHSSTEVSELEAPAVETVFENTQESDQFVSTPVNEELESEIEILGTVKTIISFKSAFAAARKKYGPGKTFVYKSNEYSTSYAEELNIDSVNFAQDQEENITAEEILAETSGTISTDVFSHADKTND
jgi:tRNA U38,U39,U40 pseudouridine synthase TruA